MSSQGGSSGQTGPGWVTAHAGAEQTQDRPGQQPHHTPLVDWDDEKHGVTRHADIQHFRTITLILTFFSPLTDGDIGYFQLNSILGSLCIYVKLNTVLRQVTQFLFSMEKWRRVKFVLINKLNHKLSIGLCLL